MERPLKRVNEKGVNGVWWCMPCIEKHEPELFRNIKEDESEFIKTLKSACSN